MSRNASGTYTLPSGNPVVSGTLIEASWANTTLSDLASAMTDSLSRSGQGGMTAAFRAFDGTSSVPGIAWGSETTTGWYRAGAGDMRLVVTGSEVIRYQSTGVNITGTLAVSGAITATGGVTGNASTATALQTARTIWGQSFNGTANVSGALTGVTDITASGNGSFGGTLAVTGAATFGGQTVTLSNSTAFFPQLINRNTTADANASYLVLDKIRGSSVVQNGDVLGNLVFRGFDGTQYLQGAYINAVVSAAPGTNDMPADLAFGTTSDGSAGPSERMRLTQAGNLGIGTSSPSHRLQVSGSGTTTSFVGTTDTSGSAIGRFRATYAGGGGGTASAVDLRAGDGYTYLLTESNVPMLFGTNNTERMRIDNAGNVGIGTSSPGAKLTVATSGAYNGTAASRTGLNIDASVITGGFANARIQWTYSGFGVSSKAYIEGGTYGSDYLAFSGDGSSEDMRLDFSGNLLVGTTSSYSSRVGISWDSSVQSGIILRTSSATLNGNPIVFQDSGGTARGSISQTSTSVSYNTSSDYRLKENIQPMTGALAKVALLKPCTYKWKADGSDGEGFIAHELAEVVPQCVTGEKDAVDAEGNPVYQGIDTSFLVATLTAAIQEQQAIIDAQQAALNQLTARIEALEQA